MTARFGSDLCVRTPICVAASGFVGPGLAGSPGTFDDPSPLATSVTVADLARRSYAGRDVGILGPNVRGRGPDRRDGARSGGSGREEPGARRRDPALRRARLRGRAPGADA